MLLISYFEVFNSHFPFNLLLTLNLIVLVTVKWGKNKYDVDIDLTEPISTFKAQVWALTNVPVERQKSMLQKT